MVLYHMIRGSHINVEQLVLKGWIKLFSKSFHFLVSLNLKGYMAFILPSGEEK